MKSVLLSFLAALLAAVAMAAAPQKSVIISYPNDTPWGVVDAAKEAIRSAGGMITHEYDIIKGFAANASPDALNIISTVLSSKYTATIEEDGIVTTQGGKE